jgi:hypothetical protein
MEQRVSLNVNRRKVEVSVADPAMPLLYPCLAYDRRSFTRV